MYTVTTSAETEEVIAVAVALLHSKDSNPYSRTGAGQPHDM
jgi:hypothetical protein